MKFEIQSYKGAGPVRFGMTTTEVREALGPGFETGIRGEAVEGEHPHDYYRKLGCFVYYDASGKVEAIEFGRSKPTLEGENLLGLSFKELFELITGLDPDVKYEGEGFTSEKLGVGCYAPGGEDEPEEPAQSIIVFRRGYYDK